MFIHSGPYNASYRNLKNHLKLADLQALTGASCGSVGGSLREESASNCWASLCDVNACLEAVPTSSSPSGYAIDAMSSSYSMLPSPSGTIATFTQPDRFRSVAVPFKQEFLSYEVWCLGSLVRN